MRLNMTARDTVRDTVTARGRDSKRYSEREWQQETDDRTTLGHIVRAKLIDMQHKIASQ